MKKTNIDLLKGLGEAVKAMKEEEAKLTPEERYKRDQKWRKAELKYWKKENERQEEEERKERIWWSNNGHRIMHRQFNL